MAYRIERSHDDALAGRMPAKANTLPYQNGEYHTGAAINAGLRECFTSPGERGTRIDMTDSYLAIVSTRGLERLVIETEHAAVFLFRQAARQSSGEALVCWAVLNVKTARDISHQINCRNYEEAFRQFTSKAYHHGMLLPSSIENEILLAS
jgi:hypothetical protein